MQDEPRGEELQRLLLHVCADDVHRFLVATQIQFRYTSYVKPEIPLGNIQNGGPQGKVNQRILYEC